MTMYIPILLLIELAGSSVALAEWLPGGSSTSIGHYLSTIPPPCTYFVSTTNGSDTNTGLSPSSPFLTLYKTTQALASVPRPLTTPLIACLFRGLYTLPTPLDLTTAHSGSSASAFVALISLEGEGAAVLSGGLDVSFTPLTPSDPGYAHIPPSARGSVLVSSLPAAGLNSSAYGKFTVQDGCGSGCQGPPLELLYDNTPQVTARWPNAQAGQWGGPWERTQETWQNGPDYFLADPSSAFFQWTDLEDVWFHGHWWWEWNTMYAQLDTAMPWNSTSGFVPIAPPYLKGFTNFSGAARFYALNSLSALDAPGEFVLNRTSGSLYWLPPTTSTATTTPTATTPTATVTLTQRLVTASGTSFFALVGLGFTGSRGTAVTFEGGVGVAILNSTVSHAGLGGFDLYNVVEATVQGNTVFSTGGGGIAVGGDDSPSGPAPRATLSPSHRHVADNRVHDFERFCFTYQAGLSVTGTGALVERNEVFNSGHFGASVRGNNLLFRWNILHHLTMSTFDNAALYFEPNDWTLWNMTLSENFAYLNGGEVTPCNFRTSCLRGAFYMDNGGAGLRVEKNVLYHPMPGEFPQSEWYKQPIWVAVNNDGGSHTTIRGNLVVDSFNASFNSGGGIRWKEFGFMTNASSAYAEMRAVNWSAGVFARAYPDLAALQDFYSPDCAQNPLCPPAPFGNSLTSNVLVNLSGVPLLMPPPDVFDPRNFNVSDNFITLDPGWVSADPRGNLDFRLREDSPAFSQYGFEAINANCFGPWSPCR